MSVNYQDKVYEVASRINDADLVLIGAGSGLSTSAGLVYDGERFEQNFEDFISRYGLTDMYSSGFYSFETREERWAYWSRHIKLNRYDKLESEVYKKLYDLVKRNEYFVITTNVDYQFYKAGFDNDKVFAVQGDYGKFQCSVPCHSKLYDNEAQIFEMVAQQVDCKIPSNLIPTCPVCGADMDVNIRKDDAFIQDEGWDRSLTNYDEFINDIRDNKVTLLELGVGYNTPSIIKYPFEALTKNHINATLIRMNRDYSEVSLENEGKTLAFDEDIAKVFFDITQIA